MPKRWIATLVLSLYWCCGALADVREELLLLNEQLLLDGGGQLADGGAVYQPALVSGFYQAQDHRAAWESLPQVEKVLQLLADSELEGLNPRDYHQPELQRLLRQHRTALQSRDRLRARFDMLLTDGVLLYVRHMLEGKVDPRTLDPSFNFTRRDFQPEDVARHLRAAIKEDRIAQVIEQARPNTSFYQQMRSALAHYRKLAADREFHAIPEDLVLKPGMTHPNIAQLRQRLVDTGYLSAGGPRSSEFDAQMQAAVSQFQRDHTLDDDGIVGRQTFNLLNLSYARRVELLRINMDRVRWIHQDRSDDFIVVNIAGFELYYLRDEEILWETPVMVGTVAHQTPIFTKRLKYLEFNPTWTVPRSIIARSLFPKFKANPQYVIDNRYQLTDRQGRRADPLQIDWDAYNGRNFPYSVVQEPGPRNALGRVKFIFPNRYAIYLHDTPARELFARSARAFSAGCVRVKHPLEFAEVLLDDPQNWSLAQVRALVDSRKPQQRVFPQRDIDVMLMYWTTSPTRGGRVQFHPDIYSKDAGALRALNSPPQVLGLAGA